MGPTGMYSLRAYGAMIADSVRLGPYAKAIAAAVRPGDTVVEIGCGVGIFALLACRAGARRVFAIETDNSIQIARELATANGLANLIDFFQSDSRKTELPERANVIVSDIRGTLPLFGNAMTTLEDARQRLLAPGGIMIPQRDTLKAAVIEAHEYYSELTSPWEKSVDGLDISSTLSLILNQDHSGSFHEQQLLTEPHDWGVLDYMIGTGTRVAAALDFQATRAGTGHGVCLWFDANLYEAIGYSCKPGTRTVYGQLFLPWLKPIQVEKEDKIHLQLHADLIDQDYVWRWETTIPATAEHPETHFVQSTFQGKVFSLQDLRRQDVNYVPRLTEAGEADLWMLERMTGAATLQSISQSALERFPRVFSSWQEAFTRAAELSRTFSR